MWVHAVHHHQRVNLSLCHKPPWLILLSQILHGPEVVPTAWRFVTWLITCLLCVCPAPYCKLSAGPSRQAVSSGVAGYSCLPDRPSPTPSPLRPLEVHLVRAASWHLFHPIVKCANPFVLPTPRLPLMFPVLWVVKMSRYNLVQAAVHNLSPPTCLYSGLKKHCNVWVF